MKERSEKNRRGWLLFFSESGHFQVAVDNKEDPKPPLWRDQPLQPLMAAEETWGDSTKGGLSVFNETTWPTCLASARYWWSALRGRMSPDTRGHYIRNALVWFMLGLVLATAGNALADHRPIRLVVNGEEVTTDVAPVIIENRVMVPVRFVSQAFPNASLSYRDS